MTKAVDLVLIGCGSAKHPYPCQAKDLYTGGLFRAHWTYASTLRATIRILSAEHGLVHPRTILAPYNTKLSTLPVKARKAWAERVGADIVAMVPPGGTIVVLAGSAYRAFQEHTQGRTIFDPFEGLPLGKRLQAIKHALAKGPIA